MAIQIRNRFPDFKTDFKNDTGLDFNKENMSTYAQYVNARCSDIYRVK
jgi:arginyl-tRNA synthetase